MAVLLRLLGNVKKAKKGLFLDFWVFLGVKGRYTPKGPKKA